MEVGTITRKQVSRQRPSPARQLSVIMFTDIVGYTSMIEHDEENALTILNHFKTELNNTVEEFNGTIIQYYGDGGLVTFHNSSDAVNSARKLQHLFSSEPKVPLRIGIHLGDILFKDGNIFGNSVNIASRIESMGTPGSVLLSGAVQKQLKNKSEFTLSSLGSFEFKNVDDPLEIFALVIKGQEVVHPDKLNGKFKEKHIKSIAVLPFVNMSNDPEQEYFSDGMSEEIINSLTHLKDLHVAGRTSSFQFKGKNIDLREIGKTLNVDTVLEGSVRKYGNRLRITAQLISVHDGYHLWSEKYDRQLDDIFAIQDEIALTISEKLLDTLLKEESDKITKSHTSSTEAYDLYLKGKFYAGRRGSSLHKGLECFQKAIETDPSFALAYSGYADTCLMMATYGLVRPAKVFEQAKKAAEKAIVLDPYLSQPYSALGYYYTCCDWNWPEAKKNLLHSIELNPKCADGHLRYGWTYLACIEGNFDEAAKHGRKSIELEPLNSVCYANYSLILQGAGKYQEAYDTCRMGMDLDASSFICHLNAATALMAMKRYEQAISIFETALKLSNRHSFAVNALIWTYCMAGNSEKAAELMHELKERSGTEYLATAITGISSAYLGNLDEAIAYLNAAFENKDPMIILLKYEYWVPDSLKADSRFINILKRIGFPETKR